jgi:phage terminase large subunit
VIPRGFHMMLKASESGIISSAELADLQREMGEDQYQQEFECSFEAAIKGAFYADEMRTTLAEGRISNLPLEKNARVHTSWDLGVSDSTAICFWQCVGRERRLIDYYESSGVGLDHYVRVLTEKRIANDWTYGEHFFPHDITVREFTSGKSRCDTLAGMGIEATIVPQHNVLDGINMVRRLLGRTWIDANRCDRLIEALRQYRREYDDHLKDWKKNALHDWTSHGADAVRTFACGFDDTLTSGNPFRRKSPEPPKGSFWAA